MGRRSEARGLDGAWVVGMSPDKLTVLRRLGMIRGEPTFAELLAMIERARARDRGEVVYMAREAQA